MHMRKSRILEKMRQGYTAKTIKINLSDPRVVEIAGMCGFDGAWLDMEHVPTDWHTIEEAIRAAKIYDTDVVVRVEKASYSDYIRPLEADAAGIIIPHLLSVEEAEQIVKTTRFHPLGMRPADGGNADGAYCLIDFPDYIRQANANRFVCVQIEDVEVLPYLDRIAGLEGIDMLFFGPGDFSQSLGTPGDQTNPEIASARSEVAAVCRRHGKFAGTIGGPGNYHELKEMGYQFINIGADVIGLSEYYIRLLKGCE